MGIPKAFFSKGMGAFCRKSGGGKAKRENALPRITALPPLVISGEARNLPYTTVKRRASDEEQPKHLGDFIITS